MNILFETHRTSFFSVQIYYICRAKNVVVQNKKYSFDFYLRIRYEARDCSNRQRN